MHSENTNRFRCVRKTAKSDYQIRHVCPFVWNTSASTGRIFMKFDVWGFFRKFVDIIRYSLRADKINGILHEDQ
jgi:hypothetical protein